MKQSEQDYELGILISDALMQDERLSSDPIDVTVLDGVATLSGGVQSYRRKALAIEIAEWTIGCRGVVDKMTVAPPGLLSDAEIAENVRQSLAAHADITKEVITVSVKAGIVTLQGNVSSQWESHLARDVALGTRGVRDVRNMLLVDLASKIEDEALTTTIQHALSRTSGLETAKIRVAVNANSAVLSGQAEAPWQRRKAEEVATRFRVKQIKNQIQIRRN